MPLFTSEYVFSDDYPTIEPSLKLDFANARALDPRITFTRASRATYVGRDGLVKYAGDDEARFDHDPTTGESLGLLIEEGRTNLIPRSQELDASTWNKYFGSSVSANYAIAPDGTQTADRIIFDGTPSGQITYNFPIEGDGLIPGQQYVFSAWVKSDGSSNNGCSLYVGGTSIQIIPTSEWKRIYLVRTAAAATGENPLFLCGVANSLLVWGVQFEEGSFPTSYIPTTATTATRSPDNASITGTSFSSWYNQSEGSVVTAFNPTLYVGPSDGGRAFRIDHQTISDNRIDYVVTGNGAYQPYVSINGVDPTGFGGINGTPFVVGTDYKISMGFAANDYVAYKNGTQTLSSTTPASVPIADRLSLGLALNGHRKFFYYYPKRLTNTQLQTLTQ